MNIILFCFMSCVIGAVVMLLIQYYAFVRYFDATTEQQQQEKQKNDQANRSGDQRFELPVVRTGREKLVGACRANDQRRVVVPLQELQNFKQSDEDGKSPTIGINLILQFLFYELRYRTDVRKWFYRKLSLELDELLTKTTTGKLFDKLSVRKGKGRELRGRMRVTGRDEM